MYYLMMTIIKGTVIKLGKSFSNITLLDKETIIAGAANSQQKCQFLQKIIIFQD